MYFVSVYFNKIKSTISDAVPSNAFDVAILKNSFLNREYWFAVHLRDLIKLASLSTLQNLQEA